MSTPKLVNSRKRLNFLPKELQPSFVNYESFCFALAVTFLLIPGIGIGLKVVQIQSEAAFIEIEKQKNDTQSQLAHRLKLREENIDTRTVQAVKKAISERVYWSSIFKELSALSPKGIWLTDLETKLEENGRSIQISGEAKSQEEVGKFLENLEKSYFFRNIKLNYTELLTNNKKELIRFQFQGSIFPDKEGAEYAKN